MSIKLAIIGWGHVGRALGRLLKKKRRDYPFRITGIHTLRHGTIADPAALRGMRWMPRNSVRAPRRSRCSWMLGGRLRGGTHYAQSIDG